MAVASPPRDAQARYPRLSPRARRAWIRVTRMRAPLAPRGCPQRTGPAVHVQLVMGMPHPAMASMLTMANASFTSNRSTSSTDQPTRASNLSMAPTGGTGKTPPAGGVTLVTHYPWPAPAIRAGSVLAPCSTRAAAPSEMELALAAVMVPCLLKAGLEAADLSGLACPVCSSSASSRHGGQPGHDGSQFRGKCTAALRRQRRSREAMARHPCRRGQSAAISTQLGVMPIRWPSWRHPASRPGTCDRARLGAPCENRCAPCPADRGAAPLSMPPPPRPRPPQTQAVRRQHHRLHAGAAPC